MGVCLLTIQLAGRQHNLACAVLEKASNQPGSIFLTTLVQASPTR
jgi:hypothetical protein